MVTFNIGVLFRKWISNPSALMAVTNSIIFEAKRFNSSQRVDRLGANGSVFSSAIAFPIELESSQRRTTSHLDRTCFNCSATSALSSYCFTKRL